MKKALLTTILLCTVAMTATAQEKPWFSPPDDCTLNGKVKEVRYYEIEMRNDPDLQDTDYHFLTYSADGHLLSEYINDIDRLCHFTYYWSSHLDSIVRDGDCASFEQYIYNTDGRLHQVISGVPSRYDADTITIIYDNRGLPISTSGDFDSKANEPWFEWDDEGRIKALGTKYWSKRYEYDSLGRMVKSYDGNTYETEYSYNEHGDLSQRKVTCKEPSYCHNGYTVNYTYTYDSYGNWIEEYHNGELQEIRKITYYE